MLSSDAEARTSTPRPAGMEGAGDSNEIGEILEEWRRRLRAAADDRPRTGERGFREQALVRALLGAAVSDGDLAVSSKEETEALAALAAAAVNYGSAQRRERLDPGMLCDELSILRDVVWRHLRDRSGGDTDMLGSILRFDRSLSIVTRAALSGGYRSELQARGSWPPCDLQGLLGEESPRERGDHTLEQPH